jgi:GAF domain-containing protein
MIDLRQQLAELDRLRAIAEYDVFHPELADRLHRLCRRTADWVGMSTAVTAVLDSAQIVLAAAGPDAPAPGTGVPAEWSFCQVPVARRVPYTVNDATTDPDLRDSPAVGLGARSYAGVPLLLAGGHALGAYCLSGTRPHEFSRAELATLRAGADEAVALIESYVRATT